MVAAKEQAIEKLESSRHMKVIDKEGGAENKVEVSA
jgi:hypothetical protein